MIDMRRAHDCYAKKHASGHNFATFWWDNMRVDQGSVPMSKPKFSGYPSSKPQYYRELWNNGPVMVEARRLARNELVKSGVKLDNLSEKAIDKLVTVVLFNSEAVFLQRAKFNLKVD